MAEATTATDVAIVAGLSLAGGHHPHAPCHAAIKETGATDDYSAIAASRSIEPWSLSAVVARARTSRFSSVSCDQS